MLCSSGLQKNVEKAKNWFTEKWTSFLLFSAFFCKPELQSIFEIFASLYA